MSQAPPASNFLRPPLHRQRTNRKYETSAATKASGFTLKSRFNLAVPTSHCFCCSNLRAFRFCPKIVIYYCFYRSNLQSIAFLLGFAPSTPALFFLHS
ncbi:hypothetical protein KSP40_PGU008626 [Platanthera guangdongensis]|uniref:Uncharacterized protein n=1 Tax=Platanthera guangdongensis TaxID=2320717 RepID=A0ABR2MJK7_9ASPA